MSGGRHRPLPTSVGTSLNTNNITGYVYSIISLYEQKKYFISDGRRAADKQCYRIQACKSKLGGWGQYIFMKSHKVPFIYSKKSREPLHDFT